MRDRTYKSNCFSGIANFATVHFMHPALNKKTDYKQENLDSGRCRSAVDVATDSTADTFSDCRKFRLFVRDKKSEVCVLVDSGADGTVKALLSGIQVTGKLN